VLTLPGTWAYWPLQDASGDATDVGPLHADMQPVGTPAYHDPGPNTDDLTFAVRLTGSAHTSITDDSFYNVADQLEMHTRLELTAICWINPAAGSNPAWELPIIGTWDHFRTGWILYLDHNTRQLVWNAGNGTTSDFLLGPAVPPGTWTMVAVTKSAADGIKLYVNGSQVAAAAAGPFIGAVTGHGIRVGAIDFDGTGSDAYTFHGNLAGAVFVASALSGGQILEAYNAGFASVAGPAGEGLVLTVDENGNPVWAPPTVEVSGGGVNPAPVDETPADSSDPAGSGPTTSTGWHLDAHVETVVLHDPNPGRFDVPTMKWVRVPFTSITIYRTWEPTVDAAVLKTARLKDDRGLMQAAKNGILHINPDMAWPDAPPMNVWIDDAIVSHPEQHHVEGWFSIEYPVLDARYLPENDIELLTLGPTPPAPRPGVDVLPADGYQRASRFMNVSTGSVLRSHAGSAARAIINWWFWGEAEISTGAGDGPGTGNLDNPFPIWGDWPTRPIHMTPPYPQLNPTDSRAYYHDSVGMAGQGFGPYRGLEAGTNLSAGANLCMQAWQDTPWLLRFSTARFPAYRGFDADYNGFPHLAVTYHYDPDTINHTTGKLLLPAT
jgi:hypothetical protein